MKKLLVIMLSLVMALTMFTACGQKEETADEELSKLGMLAQLNTSEDAYDEYAQLDNLKSVFFDDLNSMLLALESGSIDRIGAMPECVLKYIQMQNDKFALATPTRSYDLCFTMGTLSENDEVYDILNGSIKQLKDNGTIEKLKAEFIDKFVESGEAPETVNIPQIEGAKTIKVAVTGDWPPIDYIAADGTPAGFNVALLAEIAKIANVNFELVQVNSASRLTSLTSGNVDAVFSFTTKKALDEEIENLGSSDMPDSVKATVVYYESQNSGLVLK